MRCVLLMAHDEVLRSSIEAHEGFLFKHTGDGAALRPVVALQESAKRFPHIKTGEDFTGYRISGDHNEVKR